MNQTITPLVSVCIITYNHENYIRQAVESVLVQNRDFPIEILIGDDYSTDSTRNIVLDFERRHPQVVRAILSPRNLGTNENMAGLLQKSRGRYIALLEGDDLWISPQKLTKQVAFLEQHADCTICFHRTERYVQAEDRVIGVWPDKDPPAITTIEDLIRQQNYLHTSSVMYRHVVESMPDSFYELIFYDWPLHILHAQKGNIGFLPETLSRYRILSTSVFSPLKTIQKTEAVFKAQELMYPRLSPKHRSILRSVLLEYCYRLATMSLEEHNTIKARWYLARGLRYFPHFASKTSRNNYLKCCLQVFAPRIYATLSKVRRRLSSTQ